MPQAATASDLDFSQQGDLVDQPLDFSDQGELVAAPAPTPAPSVLSRVGSAAGATWRGINYPLSRLTGIDPQTLGRYIEVPGSVPYEASRYIANKILPARAQIPDTLAQEEAASPILRGVEKGAGNIGESMTSPLSIATLGTGALVAKAPVWAQRTLSLAFAAMGAQQAGSAAGEFYEAVKRGDWETAVDKGTQIIAGTVQAGMGARATVHGILPKTAAEVLKVQPPTQEGWITDYQKHAGTKVQLPYQLTGDSQVHMQDHTLESVTPSQSRTGRKMVMYGFSNGTTVGVQIEHDGVVDVTPEQAFDTAMRQMRGRVTGAPSVSTPARQAPGPQIAQPGLPLQATAPPEFQPSAPAIPIKKPPVQKIPPTTLRQQEADAQRAQKMATEPSGLSMAVDKAKQAQWGDIPANEQMLAMLPQDRPSLQPPVGPTSPESVPQGGASQAVRQAGEAVQRAQDFPKAVAEKVSQDQTPPLHPDKALTPNQLKLIHDSLQDAIVKNQIQGGRKGFIAGSGLEKWADGVLHQGFRGKAYSIGNFAADGARYLAAAAVKGAVHLEHGITNFKDWSEAMVKDHGEDVKPWLKKIYQQSASIRAGAFSQPQTQEDQNASSQQETAAIHGNVQPQQPTGGGLPAQKRGGGIQSQAAGGIQEGGEAPPSGAPPVPVRGGEVTPVASEIAKIQVMTPDQQTDYFRKSKDRLNPDAYQLGRAATSPEDVVALEKAESEMRDKSRELAKTDPRGAVKLMTIAQQFREAHEAATGTGSAGDFLRKNDPNYKPPVPLSEAEGIAVKREAATAGPHGGAAKDLPPEQKAIQDKNNSRAAWGDFGGLNKSAEEPGSSIE